MLDPLLLFEYRASLHVHSRYSDGSGSVAHIVEQGQKAGLDILWVTDHDNRRALERPGAGYYGHLLLLVGAEITPPTDHYLVFGDGTLAASNMPLQSIIDTMARQGALGFIAHPNDPGNPTARLPSYRWTDRSVDGFAGLEIWNHVSDWSRQVHSFAGGVWAALHPFSGLEAAPRDTLALWDEWGERRRVVGIGGADAHAAHVGIWPLRLTLFSYRTAFSAIRTHFYTREPLAGDWRRAQRQLLEALKAGRVAVVNAARGVELGFRFWAESAQADPVPMGGEITFGDGWTLRGLSPVPAVWELWRSGERVAEFEGTLLETPITRPGVWRVVLRREPGKGIWIYSNPIYAR